MCFLQKQTFKFSAKPTGNYGYRLRKPPGNQSVKSNSKFGVVFVVKVKTLPIWNWIMFCVVCMQLL